MESVTNTGTCLRPSCTAMVCPIISGTIIERRDHVLMTLWLPFSFWPSTFFNRWPSTKGPFFKLRGISLSSAAAWRRRRHARSIQSAALAGLATADDLGVGSLAPTGPALGLAPRGHRVAATRGLALTTTVRVVDRVHDDTTDGRALALPPHAAGLAPVDVRLLGVADLADRGAAAHVDEPHLARGHAERGAAALTGDQLGRVAGGAGDLRAAAGTQLHAVDRRTDRDVAQRQVVARLDVGLDAGLDRHALAQVLR